LQEKELKKLNDKSGRGNRLSGTKLLKKRQSVSDKSKQNKQGNLQSATERNVRPGKQDGKPTKKKRSVPDRSNRESKQQTKSEREDQPNLRLAPVTVTTDVGGTKLKVITSVRIVPDRYSSSQSNVLAAIL
jgi:hypothetical protein